MKNETITKKQDTVRARIDTNIKKDAENILNRLGLSHSAFINMSYHAIIENAGIPFPALIPNKESQEAIKSGRSRKGTTSSSVSEFRESLKSL